MARRLPAPFKKDSITLAAHGKAWQEVPVSTIEVGDIVQFAGLVIKSQPTERGGWLLEFQSGAVQSSGRSDTLRSFTRIR